MFRPPVARAFRAVMSAILIASALVVASTRTTTIRDEVVATELTSTAIPPYWIANQNGSVWNFGTTGHFGDLTGKALNKPIVGMTPTNSKNGYWLVATDGGIFSYGDARFFGSTGSIRLNKPIVGMASTPSGNGYWMVASDGGVFSYGDAQFFGSTGSIRLNKPIVGMTPTPTGKGYWMVASDGGIFAFGDARFFGSTGSIRLAKPIVSMTPTVTNKGYWLVAADGGIFAYGDAKFYGSAGGSGDNSYVRIARTADGGGYWLVRNGGDAVAYGSATSTSSTARPAMGLLYNINGPNDLVVLWAMSQRGKPYVWGASGPDSFDCSGLTQQAWIKGGVAIPRVANDQYAYRGMALPLAQARPGDLVFWGNNVNDPRSVYHVALYVGGDTVVVAPKTGDVVKTQQIWTTNLMPWIMRPRA